MFRSIVLFLIGLTCFSCASEPRFTRHFDSANWGEAFSGHLSSWETQLLPEAVALAAAPLLHRRDSEIQNHYEEHRWTSESTGTILANTLAIIPFGLGIVSASKEDEWAMLETTVEATAMSQLINISMKQIRRRERPDGSDDQSFPSGHSIEAFTGATLAARWIDDQGDEWPYKLGYALYLPAMLVSRSRVENGKHFPSDTAVGALIGMITANTIYNLHFGDSGSKQGGIFPRSWEKRLSVEPLVTEEGTGLSLSFHF